MPAAWRRGYRKRGWRRRRGFGRGSRTDRDTGLRPDRRAAAEPDALRVARPVAEAPVRGQPWRQRSARDPRRVSGVRRRHPVLVPGAGGRSHRLEADGVCRGLGNSVPAAAVPGLHGGAGHWLRRQSLGLVRDSAAPRHRRHRGGWAQFRRHAFQQPGRPFRHGRARNTAGDTLLRSVPRDGRRLRARTRSSGNPSRLHGSRPWPRPALSAGGGLPCPGLSHAASGPLDGGAAPCAWRYAGIDRRLAALGPGGSGQSRGRTRHRGADGGLHPGPHDPQAASRPRTDCERCAGGGTGPDRLRSAADAGSPCLPGGRRNRCSVDAVRQGGHRRTGRGGAYRVRRCHRRLVHNLSGQQEARADARHCGRTAVRTKYRADAGGLDTAGRQDRRISRRTWALRHSVQHHLWSWCARWNSAAGTVDGSGGRGCPGSCPGEEECFLRRNAAPVYISEANSTKGEPQS